MPETWPTSKIPRSISLFVRHVKNYFAFCSPRDHLATPPPQTPLLTFPSSLSFSLLVPRSANDPSDQSPLRLSLGFRLAPRPSAGSRHQQGPSSASEISNLQTTHGPARFPIAPLSDFAHSARLRPFLSLRLGMKGPERLDRAGYPPVPLEPSDVEQETTGLSWIYHAKDSQTNAVVAVHVSRETCTDSTSETKYTFRVSLDHAQIGALKGCAKVAPDQFPEFKQKNIDDDDPEKQKPTPPTVPNFKPPVAVAYLDSAGRVMIAKNDVPKPVAPTGSQLSLSHDGKRLLFVTEENGPIHGLKLYDSTTGKTIELASGLINQPFWSPDDSKIAFLKEDSSMWHVWTTLPLPGSQPTQLSATPVALLVGWANPAIHLAEN